MTYELLPKLNSLRWLSIESLDGEIWKDVKGWEGLYEISNYGRVKSCLRYVTQRDGKKRVYKEKIMKCFLTPSKYIRVSLEYNGVKKKYFVHRIVAETFIENIQKHTQINHKDENKSNNIVDNLEWCDAKYNVTYGTRIERTRLKAINNPKNSKPVLQYTFDGKLVKEYPSIMETRRLFGSHVNEVCLHKCLSVYGYYWIYKGDNFDEWKTVHEKYFGKHRQRKN